MKNHVILFCFLFITINVLAGTVQDFSFVVRDVDLDGEVDYVTIHNTDYSAEVEIKTGRITKYYLGHRKFMEHLVPQKVPETNGIGICSIKEKAVEFKLKSADTEKDSLFILLESPELNREIVFHKGSYIVEQEFIPKQTSNPFAVSFGPYIGEEISAKTSFLAWFDQKLKKKSYAKAVDATEDDKRKEEKGVDAKPSMPVDFKFISFLAGYYNLTVSVRDGRLLSTGVVPSVVKENIKTEGIRLDMLFSSKKPVHLRTFLGPNDRELLATMGAEELIGLGWFKSIAQLFLKALRFFYGITHNWGVAIILLTLCIKMCLHPLSVKQTKSMQEMKKVQPIVENLKERYKNDPQRMNAEVMKVYKDHNVNPFGGCLPVLVQLPILFALFTVLRVSIDLKGESFLWIQDLAEPDRFLPILVAVTMYYQQKNMPNADPNQKGMMMMMPFMMFFFAQALASGVVLYWFLSSIIGAIEQQVIARRFAPATGNKQTKRRNGK